MHDQMAVRIHRRLQVVTWSAVERFHSPRLRLTVYRQCRAAAIQAFYLVIQFALPLLQARQGCLHGAAVCRLAVLVLISTIQARQIAGDLLSDRFMRTSQIDLASQGFL